MIFIISYLINITLSVSYLSPSTLYAGLLSTPKDRTRSYKKVRLKINLNKEQFENRSQRETYYF